MAYARATDFEATTTDMGGELLTAPTFYIPPEPTRQYPMLAELAEPEPVAPAPRVLDPVTHEPVEPVVTQPTIYTQPPKTSSPTLATIATRPSLGGCSSGCGDAAPTLAPAPLYPTAASVQATTTTSSPVDEKASRWWLWLLVAAGLYLAFVIE